MTAEELDGRTLAIAVSAKALDGVVETVYHHGTLRWQAPTLWFDRGHGSAPVAVKAEWMRRIHPVEEDELVPEILDAELFLSLVSKPKEAEEEE